MVGKRRTCLCTTGAIALAVLLTMGLLASPALATDNTCATATVAVDGDNAYDNTGATLDGAVQAPADSDMLDDIWFSYVATCDGTLIIGTCEGVLGADTVLDVYSGPCGTVMTLEGTADDTPGCGASGYSSEVVVTGATSGTAYLIRLSGWNGGTVAGLLNIKCVAPCGSCPGDLDGDDDADGDDIQAFTDCAITPGIGCGCADMDADGDIDSVDVDAFVAALLGSPACPNGRCCYGDPAAPSCSDVTYLACTTLGGTWDGALDCTTPCEIGRCCYGDPMAPSCDDITQAGCDALAGDWNGALDCTTACPATPPNDNCDGAIEVTDGNHLYDVPAGATLDPTAPAPTNASMINDVWYFYTATCTGPLTIGTCEGVLGADTVLEVYSGTCAALVSVANADDTPGCGASGYSSEVVFNATLGTTYYIRLSGWTGGVVSGTMNISCVPAVPGACCDSDGLGGCNEILQTVCEAAGGSYLGDGTTCASVSCFDGACCLPSPQGCGNSYTLDTCETVLGGLFMGYGTLCYDQISNPTGVVCPCDVPCLGTPEGEPICFDGYADAFNAGCNSTPASWSTIACGDTVCGTSGHFTTGGQGYRDTDWWNITFATDSVLTVTVTAEFAVQVYLLDASVCGGIGLDEQAAGNACETVSFASSLCYAAGTTRTIFVAPQSPAVESVPCGAQYELTVTCAPCAVGACCILGTCVDVPQYTEPNCIAALGVWQGPGTVCTGGENCPPAPTNDTCLTATVALDGFTAYDTSGTTLDPAAPAPTDPDMLNDAWFTYTATCDGEVTIDTCMGTLGPDTVLEVYTGACAALTSVANADDMPAGTGCGVSDYASRVSIPCSIGQVFTIRLGGWGGDWISGNLQIDCHPLVTGACCGATGCTTTSSLSCTDAGGTYMGDGVSCTPNPCPHCTAGSLSIAYEFISNVDIGPAGAPVISNPSGASSYTDYTALVPVPTVSIAGATTDVVVSIGGGYPSDIVGIWIDYNQDLDFLDAGEFVFDGTATPGVGPHSATLNAAAGATLGNTVMRIRMQDGAFDPLAPCGTITYGETEDYTVEIVP